MGTLGFERNHSHVPRTSAIRGRHTATRQTFERFELRTRVVAWDEKWCWFEQRFCVGEAVHAVGRVKVLFRGPEGNVKTAALFKALGIEGTPERNVPEAIRLWQQAEEEDRKGGTA